MIQLGHEPHNIQVVVSNADSRLYLVNDSGKIAKEMEHVITHNILPKSLVTSHEDNKLPNTPREQLCKARLEIEGFRIDLSNQNVALDWVQLETRNSR